MPTSSPNPQPTPNPQPLPGAPAFRVPDHATAVGVPAQVVRVRGEKVNYTDTVDQTSVKNPTLEKLGTLAARVELLEKQVNQMKKEK